jgi:alkyl hydroperoxide reductase subunit AhpC
MGCDIVTVSGDTKFVHLAWHTVEKELGAVKYQMGSDTTGKLARMFGVWLEDAGVPLRGTFLIAPDGTLMNTEVNFLNMGRNIDEMLRKFKANLYLAKKATEGCPSKWKEEGDVTLKPSAKMVGKVHEALANDGNPA